MSGLAGSIAALAASVQSTCGLPVSYHRGSDPAVVLTAVPSEREYEIVHQDGMIETAEVRDYIVSASDLGMDPVAGDWIVEDRAGQKWQYEVMPLGAGRPFRWCDSEHWLMRIHTKYVGHPPAEEPDDEGEP